MANEKRLIDANALKQKQVKVCFDDDCESDGFGVVYVRHIDEAPTVDAVEVVLCGECRKYVEGHCCRSMGGGSYVPFPMNPDDFCSYGERRDGEC